MVNYYIFYRKFFYYYSQKLLDHAKQSARDALNTASERAIQKTAEATGDLIGIKSVTKLQRIHHKIIQRYIHNRRKIKRNIWRHLLVKRYSIVVFFLAAVEW